MYWAINNLISETVSKRCSLTSSCLILRHNLSGLLILILTVCTCDQLGIEIPKVLASLTVSHLSECYISTEDEELIEQARLQVEQARLKLDEAQ